MRFKFIPKSQKESDQVSSIINAFVYASHPTVNASNAGMYFTPPSVFNISFLMAQSSSLSGLTGMLQKDGNSLVGGLQLGNIAGNALGLTGISSGQSNDRLFKVGKSVLTDVSVDYAPNGWAAYTGGAPIITELTLSFMETEILDRTRMANGEVW
jgi:hypothetical protein